MAEDVKIKEEEKDTGPTHPAAIALGAGAMMTLEDKIALGKPEKFRIRGAGGARPDLDRRMEVFPRPVELLDALGVVWLRLLSASDEFARGRDNSLDAFVAEVMAIKGKQRDELLKIVQLMLVKPTGTEYDWLTNVDNDTLPDDCPKRDYLQHNCTAPDIHKLFDLFSKQNDWQLLLKNIGVVEAIAVRMQMAKLAGLQESAAQSLASSVKPAGRTSTSGAGSGSPASLPTSSDGAKVPSVSKPKPGQDGKAPRAAGRKRTPNGSKQQRAAGSR